MEQGKEVIEYHVPLPAELKKRIIGVLNKFRQEHGCRITVRDRGIDESKRAKASAAMSRDVPKLHKILLTVDSHIEQREDRIQALKRAEQRVDAFIIAMVQNSDRDKLYMLPESDDAAHQVKAEEQRPARWASCKQKLD